MFHVGKMANKAKHNQEKKLRIPNTGFICPTGKLREHYWHFFKVCSVCAFLYTKYLLVILLLSYCLSSMIASKNPAFPGMTSTITILRISLNALSGENG